MKKRIYFSIIILSIIGVSCSDSFIDLVPEDQPSSKTFFQSEEQFRQAVLAAYVPLRGVVDDEFHVSEMRSDNTHYEKLGHTGTAYRNREDIADFTNEASNGVVASRYYSCYNGISRTNIVLDRIEDAEFDESIKNELEGQVRFLRAFYYFKLVRYFGGVPLHLTEVTSAAGAFLPRSSMEAVYNQIIEDAKDAIEKLNPPSQFPQSGLATKGSATMLLAEIYMTQKKYVEAEELLKTLSAMGYGLLSNYGSVFSTANKNSKESIFEVQYQQGLQGGQESIFIYKFLPRTKDTQLITGIKVVNTGRGGYNTPTRDLINAYEDGDLRKDASIAIAEGTYDANLYFKISANKSILNYVPAKGKIGVPYIKKYLNPHTDPNNTDDNWPIYRYADALLLMAEALNEQNNKQTEALSYLNQVRDRAFGAGVATITTTDQSLLRVIIAHERRIELAFENHRWHDLVRTGEAVDVMNAYGIELKKQYNYLVPQSYQVTESKLLYPIPRNEIELNPDLIQNPGYN